MNLIDLLHHPIAECLKSLRRQPRGATCHVDDRPRIEPLESRIAPANLLVAVSGSTLNITGDADANSVTIEADGADPTIFHVSSSSDSINSAMAPFLTPSGAVTNISIKLLGGDDAVTFTNTVHIDLKGSLKIDGGDGANSVTTTDLKVEKGFSIINGTNATGTDQNLLTNLFVVGSLTIKNGDGDTDTEITRNAAATATNFSSILGSLSVTNGAGRDINFLSDTNVGKNVTYSNGLADPTRIAGVVIIKNVFNTTAHSVIGGSVSVKYLEGGDNTGGGTGPRSDGLFDTTVLGNVSFDHGAGTAAAPIDFDGNVTSDPVFIRGNLTIKGSGAQTISVASSSFQNTGLIVGKNLAITTGGTADTVRLNKLQVGGTTKIALGDGVNTLNIDDSIFLGAVAVSTGKDVDKVNIETLAGTNRATVFEKPVVISLGAGVDTITREGASDANQAVVGYSTFFIHTGGNPGDSTPANLSKEFFPLGGGVVVGV